MGFEGIRAKRHNKTKCELYVNWLLIDQAKRGAFIAPFFNWWVNMHQKPVNKVDSGVIALCLIVI